MSDLFSAKGHERFPIFESFIKRDVLDLLPPATYDSRGNQSFEDVIICRNGETVSYPKSDRRIDLDRVYAAADGQPEFMEYTSGFPILTPMTYEEHYDLGDLPSPLEMRCLDAADSSVER